MQGPEYAHATCLCVWPSFSWLLLVVPFYSIPSFELLLSPSWVESIRNCCFFFPFYSSCIFLLFSLFMFVFLCFLLIRKPVKKKKTTVTFNQEHYYKFWISEHFHKKIEKLVTSTLAICFLTSGFRIEHTSVIVLFSSFAKPYIYRIQFEELYGHMSLSHNYWDAKINLYINKKKDTMNL